MNNMHNENSPSGQDNRYDTLESLRNWELENQDQDIRGPPLIDERGTKEGLNNSANVGDNSATRHG